MTVTTPAWHSPKWTDAGITTEYNSWWKSHTRNTGNKPDPTQLPTILVKMQEARQIIQNHYAGKIRVRNVDDFSFTYRGNKREFGLLYPDGIPTMSSVHSGKAIPYSNFIQQAQIEIIAPNPLKKKRVMI